MKYHSKEEAKALGATHKTHVCYMYCPNKCLKSCFMYLKNENNEWFGLNPYNSKWYSNPIGIQADYGKSLEAIAFDIDADDKACYDFMVSCGKKLDTSIGPPCGHGMECYDVCRH